MKKFILSSYFIGIVFLLTPDLSQAQNCVMNRPAAGGLLGHHYLLPNGKYVPEIQAHCRIRNGGEAFISIAKRDYSRASPTDAHTLSRVYFEYEGRQYSVDLDNVSVHTFDEDMRNSGALLAAALPSNTKFDISKAAITGFDYGSTTFPDIKPGRSNIVAPDTQPLSCIFEDNSKKPQPFVTSCGAQVHSRVVSCRDGGRYIGPVAVLCESSRPLKDSDATDCFTSKKVADLATGTNRQGVTK